MTRGTSDGAPLGDTRFTSRDSTALTPARPVARLEHWKLRVARFANEIAAGASDDRPVVIGDSIVEDYEGRLWFSNRGIRSDHLWDRATREDGGEPCDAFARLTRDRLAVRPTAVVVLLGINDLADTPHDVGRVLESYARLLGELRGLYPSAALYCVSLLPTRDAYRHLNAAVREFNAGLARLAASTGSHFIDAHSFLRDTRGELAAAYSRDGVHLSSSGYAALTRALESAAPSLWPRRPRISQPVNRATLLGRKIVRVGRRRARATPEGVAAAAEVAEVEYRAPAEILGDQAAVDILRPWLRTRDSAYTMLYRGLCVAELADAAADVTIDWPSRTVPVLAAIASRCHLSARQTAALRECLDGIHAALPGSRRGMKTVRVLFLGDCIFEEMALFLAARLLDDGLLLRAENIVSRNPVEQERQLRARAADKLAAVFYSPFTYTFNPDFSRVMELRFATASATRIDEIVDQATRTIGRAIDVLAETVECPIFVSNASTIQRGTTWLRRVVKSRVTSRTRRRARERVNAWLPEYLERRNREMFRHLFLLDEAGVAPTDRLQEDLGAYLGTSTALHPTRFSHRLSADLADYAQAVALSSRKLIVCDLDNTLWEGVIGEGLGVAHHRNRQTVLKQLKDKGVVLAIASKNDPEKIVWRDSVLDAESFVASEVSWAPKVQGIERIYGDLNLKPAHGVFIDDRADERAMVKERWPEMHVADPCDERTWRIFSLWAELLDDEQEFDRTAMYQQRDKREAATAGRPETATEAADMFRRLGLVATLRPADRSVVKRVAELVNRTNQWNLAGSRTTVREVEQWIASSDHRVLTVKVDDRFGSMGTVCVAVVRTRPDALEIPVFVLSCRVFGYGVETLMLDHVKRLARRDLGVPSVRGTLTVTEHNGPCRDMYRDHGFVQQGDSWVSTDGEGDAVKPTWFATHGFDA